VVATGMEGALNVVMEPRPVRAVATQRPMAAPMPVMEEPMDAMAAMDAMDEPAPMPSMMDDEAEDEMAPEPMMAMDAEPMMIEAEMDEAEADEEMFAEELSLDLPEPARAMSVEQRPVAKIVDPMVEDDEPPLFASGVARDPAPQKSGRFFSLFGGRRSYEPDATPTAPRAQAPAAQARALEPTQAEIEAAEDEDDLEIPSFLRRLAN
jgi:cell division protein FtsZ